MADVSSDLKNWSTTAASNNPTDSTVISSGLADNFQQLQATVRQDLASKGADIASASTTDLGAVPGLFHDITGTTTITSFGTVAAGIWKAIKFENTLTLTHNATSLILPTGANITTANGDVAIVSSEGSGNWRCHSYMRASGQPIATAVSVASLATSGNATVGGALAVTGNATVSSALSVTGNATVSGTLAASGNATVAGTLGVTGNTTLSGNLTVSGLTSSRIPYVTTSGRITDSSSITTTLDASEKTLQISGSATNWCKLSVLNTDATGSASIYCQSTAGGSADFAATSDSGVALFAAESVSEDAYLSLNAGSPATNWVLGVDNSVSGDPLVISAGLAPGANDLMIFDQSKNVVVGTAQLANSATDGFLYIPGTTSGMPTGIPTAYSGRHPIVVDDTNNRLCVNIGGTWRYAALT